MMIMKLIDAKFHLFFLCVFLCSCGSGLGVVRLSASSSTATNGDVATLLTAATQSVTDSKLCLEARQRAIKGYCSAVYFVTEDNDVEDLEVAIREAVQKYLKEHPRAFRLSDVKLVSKEDANLTHPKKN
jgi:hypothetical protein